LGSFYGEVIMMTSKQISFQFDFVIINLKTHNLVESRNFRLPTFHVKEGWGE